MKKLINIAIFIRYYGKGNGHTALSQCPQTRFCDLAESGFQPLEETEGTEEEDIQEKFR